MPALFIYLIKVNIALLIFCLGYFTVLRRLTFYTLNRVYLVTAILFSTLYPRINLSAFMSRHEEIAKPVQVIILNWQTPANALAQDVIKHDIWYWLQLVFWVGVIVFAVRLCIQLLSLYRLHKRSEPVVFQQYMIRVIRGNVNPFSFWRSIYINPENHSPAELSAILEHEQIHVNEWHTLDILLSEISAIFYWFNPGIWLMKRAIKENIEFITDRKILQKGMDSKAYQYSLLNVNFNAQNNAIVNNFNISTIKKRIIMMNAKRSSRINITRYVLLVPAVVALLLIFSVTKAELNKTVKRGSASVIKAFNTVVNQINTETETPVAPAKKEIPLRRLLPELEAMHMITITQDTTKGKKVIDTNRKVSITLRGVTDITRQPTYYINGVKSETGLETISPDSIYSINVVKYGDPNGSVYVTTKSHAAKSSTKATLDSLRFNSGNSIMLKTPGKGVVSEVVVTGYPQVQKVRLNGKNLTSTTTVTTDTLRGTGAVTVFNLPVSDLKTKGAHTLNFTSTYVYTDSAVTVKGQPVNRILIRGEAAPHIESLKIVKGDTYPFDNYINGISDKLVMIDDKEASANDMKKLSMDKIKSLSTVSGDRAVAAYGEKARNGVVIISTKKPAKK